MKSPVLFYGHTIWQCDGVDYDGNYAGAVDKDSIFNLDFEWCVLL